MYGRPAAEFAEHARLRAEAMLLRDAGGDRGRIGELLGRSWTSVNGAVNDRVESRSRGTRDSDVRPAEEFAEHARLRAEAMLLRDAGGDWGRIGELLDRSWTSLHGAVNYRVESRSRGMRD